MFTSNNVPVRCLIRMRMNSSSSSPHTRFCPPPPRCNPRVWHSGTERCLPSVLGMVEGQKGLRAACAVDQNRKPWFECRRQTPDLHLLAEYRRTAWLDSCVEERDITATSFPNLLMVPFPPFPSSDISVTFIKWMKHNAMHCWQRSVYVPATTVSIWPILHHTRR